MISLHMPDSQDEDRTILETLGGGTSNIEERQIRLAAKEEIEEYARQLFAHWAFLFPMWRITVQSRNGHWKPATTLFPARKAIRTVGEIPDDRETPSHRVVEIVWDSEEDIGAAQKIYGGAAAGVYQWI